jgi:protein TonB
MGSPSAPNQALANQGEGSAPITDIAATGASGATPPAGLLTSNGRTSNPPAPPPAAFATAVLAPTAPAVGTPAPVPVAGIVREPKLISSVRPTYPAAAKESNVQGNVTVSANIDTNGKVVGATALSGPILLRQAAVDSVKQWKYSPSVIDGKPAASKVTVSVDFRLN